MTNKEAIKWLIRPTITTTGEAEGIQKKQLDAYHMAIEALLTNQCTKNEPSDLISRFDAIDKAKEIIFPLLDEMDCDDTGSMAHVCISMKIKILDMLHAMPSVSAERVAVWIKHEIEDTLRWQECSLCHKEYPNMTMNYCPNCGARMASK